MKHSIRYRTVDPIRGQVVKVETVYGELGSGILDKNGKEIFEGDMVKATFDDGAVDTFPVEFYKGSLFLKDENRLDLVDADYDCELEVIGHARNDD